MIDEMKIEVLKKYEKGWDLFSTVRVTDVKTLDSKEFNCRNIHDFGYVVNPNYEIEKGIKGGVRKGDYWQSFEPKKGWYNVRKLTDFEKKQ
mgnify:CR=1 FL=1